MADNLPVLYTGGPPDVVEESRFTEVRPVATGRECWWRLGPNIRHRTRTAADRGVTGVSAALGGRCVITMASGAVVVVACIEYCWLPDGVGGVMAVEVLADDPPLMPEKTDWQQMTRRGDHKHPGDLMENWRYDNPW